MSRQDRVRRIPPNADLREAAQKLWVAAFSASRSDGSAQPEIVVVDLHLEPAGASPRSSAGIAKVMLFRSRAVVSDATAPQCQPGPAPLPSPADPRVARAIELLRAHPDRFGTLSELATEVQLSTSRLRALCREQLGISTAGLRQRIRLQIAGERLAGSNSRISEIAYSVGFESLAHFDRAFRRLFGVSPKQYRCERASRNGVNI